jgi:hypothetical protein
VPQSNCAVRAFDRRWKLIGKATLPCNAKTRIFVARKKKVLHFASFNYGAFVLRAIFGAATPLDTLYIPGNRRVRSDS